MRDLSFLGRRERELRERMHGRALDLGARRTGRVDLDALVAADERFDSILSVFVLSQSRRPLRDARAIERLLAAGGAFYFLDATSSPGFAGLVQHAFGRVVPDVPGVIRAAGLGTDDCDRIVARTMWPSVYVQGVARKVTAPTAGVAPDAVT